MYDKKTFLSVTVPKTLALYDETRKERFIEWCASLSREPVVGVTEFMDDGKWYLGAIELTKHGHTVHLNECEKGEIYKYVR